MFGSMYMSQTVLECYPSKKNISYTSSGVSVMNGSIVELHSDQSVESVVCLDIKNNDNIVTAICYIIVVESVVCLDIKNNANIVTVICFNIVESVVCLDITKL